jgi:hypothetical protein
MMSNHELLLKHLESYFVGQKINVRQLRFKQLNKALPNLKTLEIEPGGDNPDLWIYITSGVFEGSRDDVFVEFMIISPERDEKQVEFLAMAAFYHTTPEPGFKLGVGHILPIGESWKPNSICTHFLVSLPYPFGKDFEIWRTEKEHGHIFWLLPITNQERVYCLENGQEVLEQKFEEVGLEYWNPDRASVV